MRLKTLILTIFLSLISVIAITGCSNDEANDQQNGHSHSHN